MHIFGGEQMGYDEFMNCLIAELKPYFGEWKLADDFDCPKGSNFPVQSTVIKEVWQSTSRYLQRRGWEIDENIYLEEGCSFVEQVLTVKKAMILYSTDGPKASILPPEEFVQGDACVHNLKAIVLLFIELFISARDQNAEMRQKMN